MHVHSTPDGARAAGAGRTASASARTMSCSRRRSCSSPTASATRSSARCRSAPPRCSIPSGRRRRRCSRCCAAISRRCSMRCRRSTRRFSPIPTARPRSGSSRLRLCFSAGEPLPAHVGEAWKARFGVDIVNGVGSTEMGHLYLTNLPGRGRVRHLRRAGRRLRPATGRRAAGAMSPTAKSARLLVRGQSAAAGYWNQREKIAPHVRRRMDAHRRQVRAPPRRRLHLQRPHRRHVQGERHLGVAVRGRGSAGGASAACSRRPSFPSRTATA